MNWVDGNLGDGIRTKGKTGWKQVHRISLISRICATITIVLRLFLGLLTEEETTIPAWGMTVLSVLILVFLLVAIISTMIESSLTKCPNCNHSVDYKTLSNAPDDFQCPCCGERFWEETK